MRTRLMKVLVLAVALGALVVPAASQAHGHCPTTLGGTTDVIIFSGTGLVVNAGVVGCIADPNDPLFDTDYITPGARAMQVRWLQPDEPVSATLSVTGIQILNCGPGLPVNGTCSLRMTATPSGTSQIWDSQTITVFDRSTLVGGTATATVCLVGTPTECTESQTHTYRTIG